MRVLLLEDEEAIRGFVRINLKRNGMDVTEAEEGETALALAEAADPPFDVALLDVMLPTISGFDVCEKLRERYPRMGIIMLTAKSQEEDKIRGLELGADDYVQKPFSPGELIARLNALKRRMMPYGEETSVGEALEASGSGGGAAAGEENSVADATGGAAASAGHAATGDGIGVGPNTVQAGDIGGSGRSEHGATEHGTAGAPTYGQAGGNGGSGRSEHGATEHGTAGAPAHGQSAYDSGSGRSESGTAGYGTAGAPAQGQATDDDGSSVSESGTAGHGTAGAPAHVPAGGMNAASPDAFREPGSFREPRPSSDPDAKASLQVGNGQAAAPNGAYAHPLRAGDIVSGPFRLSSAERRLWKERDEIVLTPTEWTLVKLLMEREGEGLSRDDILNAVWGRHYVGDLKIVDVNIRRIRQKIEIKPSDPKHIETLWGYGYRWNRSGGR